jgi:hypothetical protein
MKDVISRELLCESCDYTNFKLKAMQKHVRQEHREENGESCVFLLLRRILSCLFAPDCLFGHYPAQNMALLEDSNVEYEITHDDAGSGGETTVTTVVAAKDLSE